MFGLKQKEDNHNFPIINLLSHELYESMRKLHDNTRIVNKITQYGHSWNETERILYISAVFKTIVSWGRGTL